MDGYPELNQFFQKNRIEAAYSFLQECVAKASPVHQYVLNILLLSSTIELKEDWIDLFLQFGAKFQSQGIISRLIVSPEVSLLKPEGLNILVKFLELGADPNEDMPLKYIRNLKLIQILKEYGADINRQDVNGKCPIMFFFQNGIVSVELLDYLLKSGLDLSLQDNKKWTILMYAIDSATPKSQATSYAAIERILSIYKQNIDHIATDGYSALLLAVEKKKPFLVELLSKQKANISLKGPSGRTIFDLANADMKDILLGMSKASDKFGGNQPQDLLPPLSRASTSHSPKRIVSAPPTIKRTATAGPSMSSSSTSAKEELKEEVSLLKEKVSNCEQTISRQEKLIQEMSQNQKKLQEMIEGLQNQFLSK
jgi:ankyrin repeat protein